MRNNITLQSLRLFLRVAQTLSFSETARVEHVSQPALSRTIRLLEEQLGVRLFDRDTRNVSLTRSGAQLMPIVERVTADFDSAFGELRQTFSGERGRIIVGAMPSVASAMLPAVISKFLAERPHVDLIVRDDLSGSLLELLEERQIDFAVASQPEASDRLEYQPLMSDEYTLVCPRDHPLARESPATWSMFKHYPFIAMAPKSSVRAVTDAAFLQAGLSITPLFESAHLATVAGLIAAGLGVSALPRLALPLMAFPDIASRPLAGPKVSRSIGIVTLKSRSLLPACYAFIDLLGAAAKRASAPPN